MMDWTALRAASPYTYMWTMPGWYGLRWALLRHREPLSCPGARWISDKGQARVEDAIAAADTPVDVHVSGVVMTSAYDGHQIIEAWGRWWSPAGLSALRSVSASALAGYCALSAGISAGVLLGLDAHSQPAFLLVSRGDEEPS